MGLLEPLELEHPEDQVVEVKAHLDVLELHPSQPRKVHCARGRTPPLITDHIVSERRVNVGTSNWAWGYFRATFTRQEPAPRSTRTTRRSSRRPRLRV